MSRWRKRTLLAGALAAGFGASGPSLADAAAGAAEARASCATPPMLSAIDVALERTASRIQSGKPVVILAMGSSSTLGVGASKVSMSYPSRLEEELKDRHPGAEIKVINRGVGGQDVPEELGRLERDIGIEQPDLVIWQLGTNAVLRRDDLSADEQLIRRGVGFLKEKDIDLVLMDLQYAPRVVARPAAAEMERLIAEVAHHSRVGLFRRFDIMHHWNDTHQLAPGALIGPDGLHMTDASYGCLANQLAEALSWNWWSHGKLAKSLRRSPDAVAGMERSGGSRSAAPHPH